MTNLICLGTLYSEGCRLRLLSGACLVACQSGSRTYPTILMGGLVSLAQRWGREFTSTAIGSVGSVSTAHGYIENAIQLGLLERVGGYLKTTSTGQAAAALLPNENHVQLSAEERVLYLTTLLARDRPCLLGLLGHIAETPSTFNSIVRDITYPVFAPLSLATRVHRLRPRLEWAKEIGLVKKVGQRFLLANESYKALIESTSNPWQVAHQVFCRNGATDMDFEHLFSWAYTRLRKLNRSDAFVDLQAIRLMFRTKRTLTGNRESCEAFARELEMMYEKHRSTLSFYSPLKADHEAILVKGKPRRYVLFSHQNRSREPGSACNESF